eukprot:gene1628-biopygen4832
MLTFAVYMVSVCCKNVSSTSRWNWASWRIALAGETAADASRTIEFEETDAPRTRPPLFLPGRRNIACFLATFLSSVAVKPLSSVAVERSCQALLSSVPVKRCCQAFLSMLLSGNIDRDACQQCQPLLASFPGKRLTGTLDSNARQERSTATLDRTA